jgi:SSS family solute:Na+ symporter
MPLEAAGPWFVLFAYAALTWWAAPRRVTSPQFFDGRERSGAPPGILLVAFSAAITWIFAKSIANAADLSYAFGIAGGVGYTIYYLSFAVAGVAIYYLRTRGQYQSLTHFLVEKYGSFCARLFLLTIGFRLFNEVWSNTKVMGLYFGAEGTTPYWLAILLITLFTVAYAWSGGLRASLLTDRVQTLFAFILLGILLSVLFPDLSAKGLPETSSIAHQAGLTFCLLALVQVLSYPFHDPVLTDRAFISPPPDMLKSFLLAGALSGGFIFLFSFIGLYAKGEGLAANPSVSVPAAFGLVMMLLFNGIMLFSGGSTIDSTFTSMSKLIARDWPNDYGAAGSKHLRVGRASVIAIAVLGNLPLLSIYLGDRIGPAIIAATTISGTMVMGLAPIFLLAWLRPAGALSFHLAFWPGLGLGVIRAVETFVKVSILPDSVALGSGKYAIDLGVNIYGLLICATGYLAGAAYAAGARRKISLANET